MKQLLGEVTANIALTAGTCVLRLRAPAIAAHAVAGQFVHVRCAAGADPLLRRPYSITRIANANGWGRTNPAYAGIADATGRVESPSRDELDLLVAVVGRGSAVLAGARVGDRLDVVGPLGRGFALHPKARQILLVAGGVGIAPLLLLAEEALAREIAVTMLFGARTAAQAFPAALVPPEVEYVVLTDDGSLGRRGLVTAALPDYLPWADQVFACGPNPMLRALAVALRDRAWGVPDSSPAFAQVSLEQHMGCAMGACYGCVVDTAGGRQRVCRDGPVFDLFAVSW